MVPPAIDHGQRGGYRENVPPPPGGMADPGRVQDPDQIYVDYQGIAGYQPRDPLDPHVFPDARLGQGIVAQAQPNAPENGEHAFIGYPPHNVAPGPAQAVFPDPFAYRIPVPGPPGGENIRRLVSRYLHHPNTRISMVCMEPDVAGNCKMTIILETIDVL